MSSGTCISSHVSRSALDHGGSISRRSAVATRSGKGAHVRQIWMCPSQPSAIPEYGVRRIGRWLRSISLMCWSSSQGAPRPARERRFSRVGGTGANGFREALRTQTVSPCPVVRRFGAIVLQWSSKALRRDRLSASHRQPHKGPCPGHPMSPRPSWATLSITITSDSMRLIRP
jgi:hypothetical protein